MKGRRNPITDLAGHLVWTQQGTVWATWRVQGLSWNGTLDDKRAVAGWHRLLVRALGGEALILSSMVVEDPVGVVERMIDGLDLEQVPGWVAECEATLDSLADVPLGQRYYWLAVPLANDGSNRAVAPARAVWRKVQDVLDIPVARVAASELQRRLEQAAKVQALIPAPFRPVPVTAAEYVWIYNHACRRGQLDLPVPEEGSVSEELLVSSGANLIEPILDEGARADDSGPVVDVMKRRVLKVTDPAGDIHDLDSSYQCLMAVAETSSSGMAFPGSEWLFSLDRTGIDVDWAIRLRTNSREKVLARNRNAVRKLNEQYDQRQAAITTGLHDLHLAADLLTEYEAIFANDKQEVEIEHTMIVAVSAAAAYPGQPAREINAAAQDAATKLAKLMYDQASLKLERVPGTQGELWWAMLPGAPRTPLVSAYAHFTSSDHFSKLVPIIATRLGGSRGPVLFETLDTSRPLLGHIDLGGYPELDISGSVLFVAEVGAGKSVGQKTIASHLVDQGGQFWAIDKSEDGEWEVFARSFDSHLIVDALAPAVTMDPLRTLGLDAGAEVALSFCVQLLNLDTQSTPGVLLSTILEPGYLSGNQLRSLPEVVAHLSRLSEDESGSWAAGADELARRLGVWARKTSAAVVFDPTLPAADLTVSATTWRTHGMEQPNADELLNAHLFKQMPPEKIFGRAYYRLLTGMARRLCFADRSRATAFIGDEFYDLTQNPENVRDLQHFVRRGRRPKALFIAGSHDVGDTGDEVLAALMPTRVVMRHRDEDLARPALHWVGLHDGDPQMKPYLDLVTKNMSPVIDDRGGVDPARRGECLVRDAFGNLAYARLRPPANPARRKAVLTTPPKSKARL